jgi:hypothetical protein
MVVEIDDHHTCIFGVENLAPVIGIVIEFRGIDVAVTIPRNRISALKR